MAIRRRYFILAVTVLVIGLGVIGVIALRRGIDAALQAEDGFHAAIILHTAVVHFGEAHGFHPTDWEELRHIDPIVSGGLEWPRDEATFRELVTIDFERLPSVELVTDAIRPIGPVYQGWESIVLESRRRPTGDQ